jgi:hypothetical protein
MAWDGFLERNGTKVDPFHISVSLHGHQRPNYTWTFSQNSHFHFDLIIVYVVMNPRQAAHNGLVSCLHPAQANHCLTPVQWNLPASSHHVHSSQALSHSLSQQRPQTHL